MLLQATSSGNLLLVNRRQYDRSKFTRLISEFVVALYIGHLEWELDAHTLSVQAASKEGHTVMYLHCTQLHVIYKTSFVPRPSHHLVFAVYENGGRWPGSLYPVNGVNA